MRARRARTLLVALLLFTALGRDAPPVAAAPASDNGAWSVLPSRSSSAAAPRSTFVLVGSPGQTILDAATITNLTDAPITFDVYAADAFNTDGDGAFSLRTAEEEPTDLGAWIQLAPDRQAVTLEAGAALDVPFSITIPADATPGDHAAGIVALNRTPVRGPEGSVDVDVLKAVGVRVYLRVAGPAAAELDLVDLAVDPVPGALGRGSVDVRYTLRNGGNVRVAPTVVVEVRGLGLERRLEPRALPELLPGATLELSARVDDVTALGRVTAQVRAEAPGVAATRSASALAVPWLLLLVAAVLGGLVTWIVRRALRRRRDHGREVVA